MERGIPAAYTESGPLEIAQGNCESWCHYLRHEDVLSTEAIVWIRIVVIDGRNGDSCIFPQKVHGCHFRFGLNPGYEPASDPGDEFKAIDEGNQISLGRGQRCAP